MKKDATKKLQLSKETVAKLEAGDLVRVAGGYTNRYDCPTVWSCPVTK